MSNCIVCGRKGDKHHIIHRAENGIDSPVNIVYLCKEHHRGPHGPHNDPEFDLKLKLEMQAKLEEMFSKKYYTLKEIREMAELTFSQMKKFEKSNRLHKEGYDRNDIIFYLMGGNIYRHDSLEEYLLVEKY